MDYFDRPASPKHPLIRIPVLFTDEYDNQGLAEYRTRRGWSREDVSGGEGCRKSLDERAAFMQTWLFFGLLSTVFNPLLASNQFSAGDPFESQFQPSDYVRDSVSGSRIITLSKLSANLERRQLKVVTIMRGNPSLSVEPSPTSTKTLEREVERVGTISEALSIAHSWLSLVLSNGPYHHNLDLICLSIAALGEQLNRQLGLHQTPNWLGNPPTDFFTTRMRRDGWCPTEINRLLEAYSVEMLSFVSDLDRPGNLKDHQRCTGQSDAYGDGLKHATSGTPFVIQNCVAYQTDNATYNTKHVEGCTNCLDMIASPQLLVEILFQQNSIPVVEAHSGSIKTSQSNTHEIPIVSARPGRKYVAISHVWSDGLGNPRQNSLPACQIARISSFVESIYPGESVAFWIDTICVPIKPTDARGKAIMLLRRTYSHACSVLVLDPYVENLDECTLSNKEIWLRIMQCGWTRRLWTLQEGVLAKQLYFRCKSASLDISKLVEYAKSTKDPLMTWDWNKMRGSFLQDANMQDPEKRHSRTLQHLSAAVAFRSTSRAEDETLCLAAVTGLTETQIGEIFSEKGHMNRMKKFWSLQPYLFTECLFWSGPRLQESPWRWAPATFLGQGGALYMGSNTGFVRSAYISPEGLRFKLPGMLIGSCNRGFDKGIHILLNSSWYILYSLLDSLPQTNVSELGFILQEPIDRLHSVVANSIPILMVNVVQTQGITYLAQPISIGRISMASTEFTTVLTRFRNDLESRPRPVRPREKLAENTVGYHHETLMRIELNGKYKAFEVKKLEDQQDWCIG